MYNIEKAVKIFLEKISGKEIDIDTEKNNVTILEVLNKYGIENGSFTEDQKTIEEALLLLGAEEEVETGEGLNKTLENVSVSIQKTDEESLPANAELKLSKVENLLPERDLFGINISFLDGEGNEIAPLSEMIFTISYSGETSSHDKLSLRYVDQAGLAQPVESSKIVEITNKSVTFASDLPGTYIVYDSGGQK